MGKQKVVILYGGRSTEHEISKRSARFVFNHIDINKYDVIPIGITKDGRWCLQNLADLMSDRDRPAMLEETSTEIKLIDLTAKRDHSEAIVVFPMLHGTYGEDGCTQGFLELNSFAYVGPGVLGSSLAMDKVIAKKLVSLAGVPVVPSIDFIAEQWQTDSKVILTRINQELAFPLYVKPANLGSSVGISKVTRSENLESAIDLALSFDNKVLVESGVDAREIEFAALGGYTPQISGPGEVVASSEFYTYESKYEDPNASKVVIPAPMSEALNRQGRELALKVFQALNLYGLSRLDFFLSKDSNKYFFNEANTLPGFTSISQYPLLWKHEGISEKQLVSRLIDSALVRWEQQSKLKRSYR